MHSVDGDFSVGSIPENHKVDVLVGADLVFVGEVGLLLTLLVGHEVAHRDLHARRTALAGLDQLPSHLHPLLPQNVEARNLVAVGLRLQSLQPLILPASTCEEEGEH